MCDFFFNLKELLKNSGLILWFIAGSCCGNKIGSTLKSIKNFFIHCDEEIKKLTQQFSKS